jgi:uncharacterized membrane protein
MEIDGLPLHPLFVHGVVVLVPLAALLAILYALVPKWRYLLRHPTLAFTVAAVAMTQVASLTGQDLRQDRNLRSALLPIAGAAVLLLTIATGYAGAEAVWTATRQLPSTPRVRAHRSVLDC